MASTNNTTTIKIPYITIFPGTGDNLRLARETDCMYEVPGSSSFAWCPQGLSKEIYPHPRVNLIDRQKCHESLLTFFDLKIPSDDFPPLGRGQDAPKVTNQHQQVAHQIAQDLFSRLLSEEIGIVEFVYLLMGSPVNHPAFGRVFQRSGDSSDQKLGQKREMPKSEEDHLQTFEKLQSMRKPKGLLMLLPPPVDWYPGEDGPIDTVLDGADGKPLLTVDEIEKAILKAVTNHNQNKKHKKSVLQFFQWIAAFNFDDMSALPFIGVNRETETIPDHVLYMPDVVNKAMIYVTKTGKYYSS